MRYSGSVHRKRLDVKLLLLVCLLISFSACSDTNIPTSDGGENPSDTTQIDGQVPKVKTKEVTNISTTSAELKGEITADGSSSVSDRGICWDTSSTPDLEGNCRNATTFSGSGKYSLKVNGLKDSTTYYVRAYAKNDAGVGYGDEVTFATDVADLAEIEVKQNYVPAVYSAFISAEIHSGNGYSVDERGFCWSKNPEPDYQTSDTVKADDSMEFLSEIEGLDPSTAYYVRAFALTEKGVAYSKELSIRTLDQGNVTYTLHKKSNPNQEEKAAYQRIDAAMKDAISYYEKYTSITKELDINYDPDVPTANGNINGNINFGPKESYQQTGTALHEISHTVGVGTSKWWNQQTNDGKYQGARANEVVSFMTQGETTELNAGGIHFWPYGINGADKDKGDEYQYIMNAIIHEGMKKDGMPIN